MTGPGGATGGRPSRSEDRRQREARGGGQREQRMRRPGAGRPGEPRLVMSVKSVMIAPACSAVLFAS